MNQLLLRTAKLAALFAVLVLSPVPSWAQEKPVYLIYLAGPEVFLPDAIETGIAKKQRIEALSESHDWPFELAGLYPLDNEIPDFAPNFETGIRIFDANIDLMDRADFIAANMVRFRGPSMDVGTAFEMGYMLGLDKPVFGYYEAEPFYGESEAPGLLTERVVQYYQVDPENPEVDIHGQTIENFEMADNLMMIGALESGAGEIAPTFDAVIMQIANYLLALPATGTED